MSDKLAPSRSTVYVSNLPFQLTNNDLHQVFEKHGRVVKVTIVKDRQTRKSKGVAFILYLHREDALKCVQLTDQQTMFGRQLKCSIARDNGRAEEFIRKRAYPDKSRCYECGETGHLSYQCSRNALGQREPPKKSQKSRKRDKKQPEDDGEASEGEDPALDSLGAAIRYEQECKARQDDEPCGSGQQRKKFKPHTYFSDEEDVSD